MSQIVNDEDVCLDCGGSGEVSTGGIEWNTGAAITERCPGCNGYGSDSNRRIGEEMARQEKATFEERKPVILAHLEEHRKASQGPFGLIIPLMWQDDMICDGRCWYCQKVFFEGRLDKSLVFR